MLAHVVDLHDVRVPQPRHHLRLAREPLALGPGGEGPGQRHLEGDGAVEPQVHGLVDNPHAAAAQHPGSARSPGRGAGRPRAARTRSSRPDPGSGKSSSSRASSARNRRQPSRTRCSNSGVSRQTSSALLPESSISSISLSHARVVGHPWASARRLRARRVPVRAKVVQPLRQQEQLRGSTAAAPSWPRRPGSPRPRSGVRPWMRTRSKASRSSSGQAVDRLQDAAAVRAEGRAAALGRRRQALAQLDGVPAVHLSGGPGH